MAADFIKLVESDEVRVIPDRKADVKSMYRGKTSLRGIIDFIKSLQKRKLCKQYEV